MIKIHKVPQKGTKLDKFTRLVSHYVSVHNWETRDSKKAVRLFKDNNNITDVEIIMAKRKKNETQQNSDPNGAGMLNGPP